MELLERDLFLNVLSKKFSNSVSGEGNVVFLAGEAGIGKTSLVNCFLKNIDNSPTLLFGACDSFFTPRPLGPLYDISGQLGKNFLKVLKEEEDRALIFSAFFQELIALSAPTVVVIEDIHWADEATIDFIKFIGRRISRLKCLLLLTYRDDEIHNRHPLKSIFGELQPDIYTKLIINRLSPSAVNQLAIAKGYENGDQVYHLTGGNPFYVNEVLASYSPGIPDRVKDSVLSAFRSMDEKTQSLWEFLSIFPSGIDLMMVEKLDIDFPHGIDNCIRTSVIIDHKDHFTFKHELFRLAIEESLASHKRKAFHSKVLNILLEHATTNLSRIVHHAKFAGEKKIVAEFSVLAAEQASNIGSHIEAARLYQTAIEYKEKENGGIELYERHAQESYLSSQFEPAIESLEKVLTLSRINKDDLREANTLRFLSRLWLLRGDLGKSILLAQESVNLFDARSVQEGKAKANSNLAQLYLISEEFDKALLMGEKAIELAEEIDDKEALVHALISVGMALVKTGSFDTGSKKLNEAIVFAREHGLIKQTARSYCNFLEALVVMHKYSEANDIYNESMKFCETNDLSSSVHFLAYWRSVMLMNKGDWNEAEELANKLQNNNQSFIKVGALVMLARIEARRGNFENAKLLINRIRDLISTHADFRYSAHLLSAELELHWVRSEPVNNKEDLKKRVESLFSVGKKSWLLRDLYYWAKKVYPEMELEYVPPSLYQFEFSKDWKTKAAAWKDLDSTYEEALALIEGNEASQKSALVILDDLGAKAVYKKVQLLLKFEGVKNIPRGLRDSTRSNPVHLTIRQVEVLRMLKAGLQNSEIAEKLFVTSKTVEQHVTAILSKLEVTTRAKAVLEAEKRGLL